MTSRESTAPPEPHVFDMDEEIRRATGTEALAGGGRATRVLVDTDELRVTLIAMGPGGELAEHRARGPITVQPLRGQVRFTALGRDHDLGPGHLLTLPAEVPHAVASGGGAAFLLTMAKPSRTPPSEVSG